MTDLEVALRDSVQGRAHNQDDYSSVPLLLVQWAAAAEEVSPWWTPQRDVDLRAFFRGEP